MNSVIIGLITGIIVCLYIQNFIKSPTLSNFIEPYIIFGVVLFLLCLFICL